MADFINLDAAYDSDTLTDWYISSVGSEPPVWTDEHIEELLNDFYVIPKDTPKADVEPVKHGHWVGYETKSYKNSENGIAKKYYRCSSCRCFNAIRSNYCPKCGAKMDGGVQNGRRGE